MTKLPDGNRARLLLSSILSLIFIGGGAALFHSNAEASLAQKQAAPSEKKEKRANRLINEKSPYLLQHAHNPVDWYPWSEEAFEKARKENKLIFLSIGYSTCYWCHVMEREVFENEEIAALMNQHVVSIKVDREERPDVDRVYMAALQTMTHGSGGWPMSLFLTPDLKPFYGATYLPADSFRSMLTQIQNIWTTEPDRIKESGQSLTDFLKHNMVIESAKVAMEKSLLTGGFERFRQSYDAKHAGFGNRPKFPRPVVFDFLLRYHHRSGEREALNMSLNTLRKMAEGGMYDHLGGGFHRYSVDAEWRVPHFEKMLYDQAQLISAYLDAYQMTGSEYYAAIARDTLQYVLNNLTDKEGGFYSAEDAESATEPNRPKEEGAFYLWTAQEIEKILGKERADIFSFFYGARAEGNALEDPHKVFEGKNILYVASAIDETAKRFKKTPEEVKKILADSRATLFIEREKRPRPHLDDKVLVSWNGLMISAAARAHQVLGDEAYLQAAEKSASFILAKLYDAKEKRLLRRYRAGEARYEANLEDYAFFIRGLLDLYEASLDIGWLKRAIELTDRQNALFYDEKQGGFFTTSGRDDSLLFRSKDDYDAAEPSGNSVATMNLLRLAQMTNNAGWREMADRTIALFGSRLKGIPQSLPLMLAALDFHLDKPAQIIIAGSRQKEDTKKMLREAHRRYLPNKIILLADGGEGQRYLSRSIPFMESVKMLDNKATVYICENYACKLPTSDVDVMSKLLEGEK